MTRDEPARTRPGLVGLRVRYQGRPAALLVVLSLDAAGGAVTVADRDLFTGEAAWALHAALYGQRVAMIAVAVVVPVVARHLFPVVLVVLLGHLAFGVWTYADPRVAATAVAGVVAIDVLAVGWCRPRAALAVVAASAVVVGLLALDGGLAAGPPGPSWLPALSAAALVPAVAILLASRRPASRTAR